jgi:hypothetical protein
MATRWTNRLNPLSWITRRRPRTAPVVPTGQAEFKTPSAYVGTSQHDYSAADRPFQSHRQEWFAESASAPDFHATETIYGPATMNNARPRTKKLQYDANSGILRVTYRDNDTYEYANFSQEHWDDLSSQKYSTGKWLDTNLLSIDSGTKI